jgi:lipopolysaccharide/colanic/teichoic acid biosynthesis glycosyltransferase
MSRQNQLFIKHILDRILALALLLAAIPVWVIIIVAIKREDGGPVFFCQERIGEHCKIFTIYKFRTMIVDADRFLDSNGRVLKKDRVTKVGKVLRFLSLDETPQLLNIIKGEMSIIGPRPMLPALFERLSHDQQKKRMTMRPGVTGLAQIHGRNTLKWSQRIEYDIQYAENYSLKLDLIILLKTVKVVLFREGIVVDRNPEQVDDLPPIQIRDHKEP